MKSGLSVTTRQRRMLSTRGSFLNTHQLQTVFRNAHLETHVYVFHIPADQRPPGEEEIWDPRCSKFTHTHMQILPAATHASLWLYLHTYSVSLNLITFTTHCLRPAQMLSFMHAQYSLFQQGYNLLDEIDPYMKKLAAEVSRAFLSCPVHQLSSTSLPPSSSSPTLPTPGSLSELELLSSSFELLNKLHNFSTEWISARWLKSCDAVD